MPVMIASIPAFFPTVSVQFCSLFSVPAFIVHAPLSFNGSSFVHPFSVFKTCLHALLDIISRAHAVFVGVYSPTKCSPRSLSFVFSPLPHRVVCQRFLLAFSLGLSIYQHYSYEHHLCSSITLIPLQTV